MFRSPQVLIALAMLAFVSDSAHAQAVRDAVVVGKRVVHVDAGAAEVAVPDGVVLAGSHVRLEPLVLTRDVEALFAVSNGSAASLGERRVDSYDAEALVWRNMSGGPFDTADELATWLRGEIRMLPDRQAAIFSLAYFEQLSRNEIATALEVTPETVSTALYKARKKLSSRLAVIHGEKS